MKHLALTTLLGAAVNAADTLGNTQQLLGLSQQPQVTTTTLRTQSIQSGNQVGGNQVLDSGANTQIIDIGGGPIQINVNDLGQGQQGDNVITVTSSSSSSGAQGGFDGAINLGDNSQAGLLGLGGASANGNQIALNGSNQAQIQLMLASMRNQGQPQQGQQTQTFQQNSIQILNNAAQSIYRPQIAFDSIFVRFPTVDQLDHIIISGDSTALLKTIQTVLGQNTVRCDKKIAYLLELLGRLRIAVQKKSRLAVKLKVVIQSSINQIQKLQAQQDGIRKDLNGLGLEELKASQRRINKELEDKYGVQNDVESQLPILQAGLMGVLKEIEILKKDTENQRSRTGNDQLKLIDIRAETGRIQSRLTQLLDLQAAIRDRVNKSQGTSSQNQTKIRQLRNKIASIQIDIKKLSTDQDASRTTVKDLQVRVERLRTDLAIAQSKNDQYTRQIKSLQDKIAVQKKKSDNNTINSLQDIVLNLKDLLPSVTSAVDKQYYTCYGAGSNVKITRNGNVTVAVINGARVGDYLKSLYGGSIKIPGINGDVAFNRIDVFSPEWAGKYGYPMSKAAFNNEDFSFAGSFACNNPNLLSTGFGTISNIGSDFIEALDEKGSSRRMVLGSCSRLESTQQLPKIGQRIYWQGAVGSRGINLYSASCME